MPTFLIKPLLIGGVFLSVVAGFYFQSHKIDRLQAELSQRDFQNQQLKIVNRTLEQQIVAEQQAVFAQQKYANQLQEQVNARTETVRTIFKTEPCARTRLPAAAIEQLREAKARP